jgi:hypothetical protein
MTSSAELQREAVVARAGLASTLDDLRTTFTTTALTSGAMTLAKEGSSTLARAAVDRVRGNPLAALLIGAGLVMLLHRNDGGSAALLGKAGNAVGNAVKGAVSAIGGAVDGTRSAAESVAAGGERIAGNAAAAASDAASAATGAVSDAVDSVSALANDTMDRTVEGAKAGLANARHLVEEGKTQAHKAIEQSQRHLAQGQDMLAQFAEEQPILVAALGVALGAALGASLPITEAERRYLGSSGQRVAEAGKQVATRVADAITDQIAGTDMKAAVDKAAEGLINTVKEATVKATTSSIAAQ